MRADLDDQKSPSLIPTRHNPLVVSFTSHIHYEDLYSPVPFAAVYSDANIFVLTYSVQTYNVIEQP